MDWADHGFKTGRVTLPGLEIEVDLKREWFRNDGPQWSLARHKKKLEEELGMRLPGYFPGFSTGQKVTGMTYTLTSQAIYIHKICVVAVKKSLFPSDIIFRLGHESTHTLLNFGREKAFVNALNEYHFSLNPFERYGDEEEICDVGGIFALYRRGLVRKTSPDLQHLYDDLLLSRR